jgi:hypothetical protein
MSLFALRAGAFALAACLPAASLAAEALTGTYALPDGRPKVTATLIAAPGRNGAKALDITMTETGQQHPITKYETELSKQLHLIAVSSDFRTFVHEHGDRPGSDGHFRIAMRLPHPGLYHVYADGVLAGLGQQVMRFELDVGDAPAQQQPSPPAPTPLEAADGRYAIRFDPFTLRAGQESQLSLHLSRDGRPAPDITLFLGVAAHAVFIGAADLTYVHVHAAPAVAPKAGGTGAPMQHDLTGRPGGEPPEHHGTAEVSMSGMDGMSGGPLPSGAWVPPDLSLYVLAPEAGTYLIWLQFMAGGQVRTVPFVVAVA